MQHTLHLSDEEALRLVSHYGHASERDVAAFRGIKFVEKALSCYALPFPRVWKCNSKGKQERPCPMFVVPSSRDVFFAEETKRVTALVKARLASPRKYRVSNVQFVQAQAAFMNFSFFCSLLINHRKSANGANIKELFFGVLDKANETDILASGFRRETKAWIAGASEQAGRTLGNGVYFATSPEYYTESGTPGLPLSLPCAARASRRRPFALLPFLSASTNSCTPVWLSHLSLPPLPQSPLHAVNGSTAFLTATGYRKTFRIVLVLMAAGDYAVGQKDSNIPPVRANAKDSNDTNDSAVDSTSSPTIYVGFNDFQAYPYAFFDLEQTTDNTPAPAASHSSPFVSDSGEIPLAYWSNPELAAAEEKKATAAAAASGKLTPAESDKMARLKALLDESAAAAAAAATATAQVAPLMPSLAADAAKFKGKKGTSTDAETRNCVIM